MREGLSSKLELHLFTNCLALKNFCMSTSRNKTKMEKYTLLSGLKFQMKIVFLRVKSFY